jgi:hypothetical protein
VTIWGVGTALIVDRIVKRMSNLGCILAECLADGRVECDGKDVMLEAEDYDIS